MAPQPSAQGSMFGLPLSNMNFGMPPAPIQQNASQIQPPLSLDFMNMAMDKGSESSSKLDRTGYTDSSFAKSDISREEGNVGGDNGYIPPSLFDNLNLNSSMSAPKVVPKSEPISQPMQFQPTSPSESYTPPTPGQFGIPKNVEKQSSRDSGRNEQILEKNEMDNSISSIHNLSKHSINDGGTLIPSVYL